MYLIDFLGDAILVIIFEKLFDLGGRLDDLGSGLYGLVDFSFDLVLVAVCHLESTYIMNGFD